ncbi:integrase [Streptomyces venezuelae]|uniref:Integrase n=1 Tax=Streptomyces venezuelae TaxID=54571 RepID=A0A5P2B7P0_STRVZ|nr:integrase [Streptomyces venezuelae]QES25910.1 integrase [Streptomyces venezuelae]
MAYVEWRGNTCRVVWNTGAKDDRGKWIYDQQGGFTDEAVAKNYGLDREADIRNDRYVSKRDGSLLMRDYCRTWPDTLDVGHLRDKAIRSMLRLYIVPRWGDTAVGDIKPSAYRAWKIQLKAKPNVGDKYGEEILTVFSMLMDDAVDDGLRAASPVPKGKRARRGKYKKKPRERKREMRIADVHQLACNALTFWGLDGFVFVWTMACTGMRPAELYALRRVYTHPAWPASDPLDDPDEHDRAERHAEDLERYGPGLMPAVRVQWQHQRKDGALQTFPPKYESRRALVLPPFLTSLLGLLLASHDGEYVFRSVTGGLLANANFTYYYWRPIADGRDASADFERTRLGQRQTVASRRPLPEIPATSYAGKRLYLLRHGHKEWIDEDGHSRIATESRMGHEVAGVEGLYANVTTAMEQAIMDSLQERFERFLREEKPELPDGSPISLPLTLVEWWNRQVTAVQHPE